MKLKEVLSALEQFAPLPLQESWDNAGLQIGLTEADEVSGALLCLDVTPQVVDEAVAMGYNLVVSHHPLLFHGLKQIDGSDDVQRAVVKAIRNGVAIVSMHTNLDNAPDGVNWKIAERLQLTELSFFAKKQVEGIDAGSGVIGTLTNPLYASDFVAYAKKCLEAQVAQCNELLTERPIRRVAVCGGAGDFLLPQAIAAGADAFITGEMHYHVYQGHSQQIQIVVLGHYETEHFTAHLLHDCLNEAFPSLPVAVAETMQNPIHYL